MTQDMNDNAPSATTPSESATEATPGATPEARIAALEAELAEAKDRLLRTLAESENQRRRAQRERDDAQRYAAANFAKDLLDVADNLGRALASVSANDVRDERLKSLLEGVAATERALLAAFERNGIKRIEPRPGDRFDFNLHQAMFEVENSGRPAGAVVQVLQPGYQMHDRLLRPALVGVAKAEAAPPKDIPRVDTVV
jgi:molecular chaperone GrpE